LRQYISIDLSAPDVAVHLLDTLEDAILSLSQLPHRFPLTSEEPWYSAGIHKMPVNNYLVYFWIDENSKTVQITAVVYGSRDQARQLSQMMIEF
jgi:toxin ParE1/3/4